MGLNATLSISFILISIGALILASIIISLLWIVFYPDKPINLKLALLYLLQISQNIILYGFYSSIGGMQNIILPLYRQDIGNATLLKVIPDSLKNKSLGTNNIISVEQIDYTIQFTLPRHIINHEICIIENTNKIQSLLAYFGVKCSKTFILLGFISQYPVIYLYDNIAYFVGYFFTLPFVIYGIIVFHNFTVQGRLYTYFYRQSMESLSFEKSFDAFSKDPIEARMIITPAFMNRLEQFSEKWNLKGKIRIIFKQDTFTFLLKGDIEKYGKESDGTYTLIKSMEDMLNLKYYSLSQNTNNQ